MPTVSNDKHGYLTELELYSAHVLISSPWRCFQIPDQQRQFSWYEHTINRLIKDILRDMKCRMIYTENNSNPKFDPKALSFMGTVVCCKEGSENAYTVIDGQQRLTVFMILSIILHDYINNSMSAIGGSTNLKKQCEKICDKLKDMFEQRVPSSENPLPCMIRESEDMWPGPRTSAQYKSPISHYISHYEKYHRERGQGQVLEFFDYYNDIINDQHMAEDYRYKQFGNAVNCIRNKIYGICEPDSNELCNIEKILAGSRDPKGDLLEGLFISNIPNFSLDGIDFENPEHQKIIRAFLISVYLMYKVRFAFLVATDEGHAFDIFDSLNTTGELLTAYETFRPEIIRTERDYKNKPSWKHICEINKYLENSSESKSRKKITDEMLISFALAESGKELSTKLNDQRNYLKETYEDMDTSSKRADFTRHMMHVSGVYQHLWYGRKSIGDIFNLNAHDMTDEEQDIIKHARFAMGFIKETNHFISAAIISRFYEQAKLAKSNLKKDKALELCGAIKAIAAFFALWRSCNTTDGIDDRYRKMFDNTRRIRLSRQYGASLSLPGLKKEFCDILKTDGGNSNKTIPSLEKWIDRFEKYPIYRSNKKVAKFILLTAAHNSIEGNNNGYLRTGTNNNSPVLLYDNLWGKNSYKTIEHIIPQKPTPNNNKPKLDVDTLNYLGNLTLLPTKVNAVFSNRPWKEKKLLFNIIAAKDDNERDKHCKKANQSGIDESITDKLKGFDYLPMAKTLSKWQGDFSSPKHINNRGKNLMIVAWPTLSDWLDFDSN